MRLNNLNVLLSSIFFRASSISLSPNPNYFNGNIKDVNGKVKTYFSLGNENQFLPRLTLGSENLSMIVGTNSSESDENMHSLYAPINDSYFSKTTQVISGIKDGKVSLTITTAFRKSSGTTTSETISEIGLLYSIPNETSVDKFLIVREVLPEPVILDYGETVTFSITIEI